MVFTVKEDRTLISPLSDGNDPDFDSKFLYDFKFLSELYHDLRNSHIPRDSPGAIEISSMSKSAIESSLEKRISEVLEGIGNSFGTHLFDKEKQEKIRSRSINYPENEYVASFKAIPYEEKENAMGGMYPSVSVRVVGENSLSLQLGFRGINPVQWDILRFHSNASGLYQLSFDESEDRVILNPISEVSYFVDVARRARSISDSLPKEVGELRIQARSYAEPARSASKGAYSSRLLEALGAGL